MLYKEQLAVIDSPDFIGNGGNLFGVGNNDNALALITGKRCEDI